MKRVAILILLAILSGWIATPQPRIVNTYSFVCDTTPSGASAACTVQQPASGAKTIQFIDAFVYTVTATDITVARDGTAATATAGTANKLNSTTAAATVSVYTASNVGAGTTLSTVPLAAAGSTVLDLEEIQMIGNGTAKNLTIKTGTTSARVVVVIRWREFGN